jgi:hypothetical protein
LLAHDRNNAGKAAAKQIISCITVETADVAWRVRALLRVIAVDLLAGFADLLHDQVSLMTFHNLFDEIVLVPRADDEAVALGRNLFILGRA